MQAQARQCFELLAGPFHAFGHETFFFGQCGVGVFSTANAPNEAVGFKSGTPTRTTFGVAAVFRQEHTDVHLVGFAFKVAKEAVHAIPLLVPFAVPIGRAFDHPLLLLGGQLEPWGIARNARSFGVAHQVVLRFFPCWCLNGLDGASSKGELVVGNDQTQIDTNDTPKTPTCFASPHRRVEREHRRQWLGIPQITFRTMQPRRESPHAG